MIGRFFCRHGHPRHGARLNTSNDVLRTRHAISWHPYLETTGLLPASDTTLTLLAFLGLFRETVELHVLRPRGRHGLGGDERHRWGTKSASKVFEPPPIGIVVLLREILHLSLTK